MKCETEQTFFLLLRNFYQPGTAASAALSCFRYLSCPIYHGSSSFDSHVSEYFNSFANSVQTQEISPMIVRTTVWTNRLVAYGHIHPKSWYGKELSTVPEEIKTTRFSKATGDSLPTYWCRDYRSIDQRSYHTVP